MGADEAWWSSRSSKPRGGRVAPVLGGFDPHTLPPEDTRVLCWTDRRTTFSLHSIPRLCIIVSFCGAVAQLGARLNGIEKARGSNPLSSIHNRARSAVWHPGTDGSYWP